MSAEGPPPQSGPPQEGSPPPGLPINIQGPNGEQPTPEQIRQIQMQIAAEAEKNGMTVQEYVQELRKQAIMQQQAQMRAQQEALAQQQQQQQQQQPIQPGPPKPEAIAVANWLKTQDLKPRTVVHDEKRKDMFRGQEHRI
jgi:translocation protein SEC62